MALYGFATVHPSNARGTECPTQTTKRFAKDALVYYAFSGNLSTLQRAEIATAITIMNTINGVGVTLLYQDGTHAASLVFQNVFGNPQVNCVASESIWTFYPNTVNFYPGAKCGADPNGPSHPSYPFLFDESLPPGIDTFYLKTALHEIGHGFGLGHPSSPVQQGSIMNALASPHAFQPNGEPNTNDVLNWQTTTPSGCDKSNIHLNYNPPPPPPTGGGGGCRVAELPSPQRCIEGDPCCPSPIIVDVDGDGFDLTSAADGVWFDIAGNGQRERLSWTSSSSDDAWLALDRNSNGTIDDGSELFGNYTDQSDSDRPNGFLALAEFDKEENGGNGDGWITNEDAVFSDLRLWRDVNHNGISEASELYTLSELGITALDIDYRRSTREDEYGNQFRYRGQVHHSRGAQAARWAYDVFLSFK